MIDSQLVQNRGVEVANVNRVFGDVVSELVRLAVVVTRLDSAACHPDCEASAVVIPASRGAVDCSLAVDRASEFAAPDNKCFIQHAILLQILDQGG